MVTEAGEIRNDWVDLSSSQSVYAIDDAIREKWQRSFGSDFWHVIYPLVTLVRPRGGQRWESWMLKFEQARAHGSEAERRTALFALIEGFSEYVTDDAARITVSDGLKVLPEWGPVTSVRPDIIESNSRYEPDENGEVPSYLRASYETADEMFFEMLEHEGLEPAEEEEDEWNS